MQFIFHITSVNIDVSSKIVGKQTRVQISAPTSKSITKENEVFWSDYAATLCDFF